MNHIYLLGQQSILRFYLLLLKWLSLDICQLQRKCTESFLETCREISVVSSPFVGQSPASMGSLSFFTVHANKFVSTKNSRNPRRVLLAILSLALSLFRSLPFTLPLFLSIRRIYLCECGICQSYLVVHGQPGHVICAALKPRFLGVVNCGLVI